MIHGKPTVSLPVIQYIYEIPIMLLKMWIFEKCPTLNLFDFSDLFLTRGGTSEALNLKFHLDLEVL